MFYHHAHGSSHHGHSHGGDTQQADIWTNIGGVMELLTSTIAQFLFFAPTIDNVFNLDADIPLDNISLSTTGAAWGGGLAVFITVAVVYTHYIRNLVHQKEIVAPGCEQDGGGDLESQAEHSSHSPALGSLRHFQIAALVLDLIGHGSEVVGATNFLLNLVVRSSIDRWASVSINAGLFGLGLLGSWADVRTCRESIVKYNRGLPAQNRETNLDVPLLSPRLLQ